MSLEAKIDALTSAVLGLTYALNQSRSDVGAAQPEAVSIAVKSKPSLAAAPIATAEVPNEKPKTTTAHTVDAPSPSTSSTTAASESESVAVTYDDVKKLIIAISKESKDKAVASLQRFGVANGKQLTESTYPEVVAYLTKVLAGEVNPEESHG
jgi:hypothetical protein